MAHIGAWQIGRPLAMAGQGSPDRRKGQLQFFVTGLLGVPMGSYLFFLCLDNFKHTCSQVHKVLLL